MINKEGVSPVAAKVYATKNVPIPEDVNQFRAFLEMLNYYQRFLPDSATTLEPLRELLSERKNVKTASRTAGSV